MWLHSTKRNAPVGFRMFSRLWVVSAKLTITVSPVPPCMLEHRRHALRILELACRRDGAAGIGCCGRDVLGALERHRTCHQAARAAAGHVDPPRIDVVVLHGARHDLVGVLQVATSYQTPRMSVTSVPSRTWPLSVGAITIPPRNTTVPPHRLRKLSQRSWAAAVGAVPREEKWALGCAGRARDDLRGEPHDGLHAGLEFGTGSADGRNDRPRAPTLPVPDPPPPALEPAMPPVAPKPPDPAAPPPTPVPPAPAAPMPPDPPPALLQRCHRSRWYCHRHPFLRPPRCRRCRYRLLGRSGSSGIPPAHAGTRSIPMTRNSFALRKIPPAIEISTPRTHSSHISSISQ